MARHALQRAVLHPLNADPVAVSEAQMWFRTDSDRMRIALDGTPANAESVAYLSDLSNSIGADTFDAQSILLSVADSNPEALTITPSTLVGRKASGDAGIVSAAEARAILNVEDNAAADQTAAEILSLLLTVDGPGSGLNADSLDGVQGSAFATTTAVDTAISTAIDNLVGGSGAALDTLKELADALGGDANYAATTASALALRTKKFAADIGDGSALTYIVSHNLGTEDFTYSVRETASKEHVISDCKPIDANSAELTFGTAPATDAYRVVFVG